MPTQIKAIWEAVPIPTRLILDSSPEAVGAICYALALLHTSRESENFDSLVQKISEWNEVSIERVRECLISKLGLRAKSLYSPVSIPAPSYTSKSTKNVTPQVEPIDAVFLDGLKKEYPILVIADQYMKATEWYSSRHRSLTRTAFINWLNNAIQLQAPKSKSSATKAVASCSTCKGKRRILGEDDGIPITIDCPDCVSPLH